VHLIFQTHVAVNSLPLGLKLSCSQDSWCSDGQLDNSRPECSLSADSWRRNNICNRVQKTHPLTDSFISPWRV